MTIPYHTFAETEQGRAPPRVNGPNSLVLHDRSDAAGIVPLAPELALFAAFALAGCTDAAMPDSNADRALMVTRLIPLRPGQKEMRFSVGNVSRPLWMPGERPTIDLKSGGKIELEVATRKGPGTSSGDLRPGRIELKLTAGTTTRVLAASPVEDALESNAASCARWHSFVIEGVPDAVGEWSCELLIDGRLRDEKSPWLVSNPRFDARTDDRSPPSVLFITVDTLRAEYLGAYGHDRPTSPCIDAFAREGVLFEHAISQASWTLPSYASMLTGLYAEAHGVVHRDHRLNFSHETFVERFAEAQYSTAGFVSGTFTDSFWGFDQGFDSYDDLGMVTDDDAPPIEDPARSESMAPAEKRVTSEDVTAKAMSWLDRNLERRFFLFVHYFDPHSDFVEHPGFSERFAPRPLKSRLLLSQEAPPADLERRAALYEGEIAFTDHSIGRLLEHLKSIGRFDDTIVILCADHGEEFHERGKSGHGHGLFTELVRVPLIVRVPQDRFEPGRVSAPVGNVDLAPTLIELCGLRNLPDCQGESLVPLLSRAQDQRTGPVYSSHFRPFPPAEERLEGGRFPQWQHRIDERPFTLINIDQGPSQRAAFLFDHVQDPAETRNLLPERKNDFGRLNARYQTDRGAMLALRPPVESVSLSREICELLEELGYTNKKGESQDPEPSEETDSRDK